MSNNNNPLLIVIIVILSVTMIVGGIMFKEHQDNTEKEMKAYIDSKTKTTSNQPPLYYQAGAAVYVDGHMPEKR